MPRAKHAIPRVTVSIRLPAPLIERIRAEGEDPVFHKTKQGAVSDVILRALNEYYARKDEVRAQTGGPRS